jgi:hypothetical protein
MAFMPTMNMARVAHLHEFGIVAPTDRVMPVCDSAVAAATFAPSSLQESGWEIDALARNGAVPGVVIRPTALGAMPGALRGLQKLAANVQSAEKKNTTGDDLAPIRRLLYVSNGLRKTLPPRIRCRLVKPKLLIHVVALPYRWIVAQISSCANLLEREILFLSQGCTMSEPIQHQDGNGYYLE